MIAIVDSGGANISSVLFALQRLGCQACLTADADEICNATKVILPGVGAAKDAMAKLQTANLIPIICQLQQPVLGVCLGMQLLYQHSQEGKIDCLGLIPGNISHFPDDDNLIVPHMGWNNLHFIQTAHPLLKNVAENDQVYFVHSYRAPLNAYTVASCDYGGEFTAIVQYKNFYATQFHPERSGKVGRQILANFLEIQ
jgi:imidazole glycerol-phosphate synthase subunit HisH